MCTDRYRKGRCVNMNDSFYLEEEINNMNFRKYGENVHISRKTSIYNPQEISLGNNVRIDDFCVLSGKINIGNHVHIAVYSALFGGKTGIDMDDFSGLSSRCTIYAESDDYSGKTLTNPTIPEQLCEKICKKVILHRHAIVGAGTVILPGVTIGEGTAIGSMSLVTHTIGDWAIYAGIPCKRLKNRQKELLNKERLLQEYEENK